MPYATLQASVGVNRLPGEDTDAGFGSGVQHLLLAQALLTDGWRAASVTDGCRNHGIRAIKLLKEAEVTLLL